MLKSSLGGTRLLEWVKDLKKIRRLLEEVAYVPTDNQEDNEILRAY